MLSRCCNHSFRLCSHNINKQSGTNTHSLNVTVMMQVLEKTYKIIITRLSNFLFKNKRNCKHYHVVTKLRRMEFNYYFVNNNRTIYY